MDKPINKSFGVGGAYSGAKISFGGQLASFLRL